MDWLGIGVLIIGIALLIIAIISIKPILKLATLFDSLKKTSDKLPDVVEQNATEANLALKNVNTTLQTVNKQIEAVNPLFEIVEDAGLASRRVTSKWLNKSSHLKGQTDDAKNYTEQQSYEGLYRILSFFFYLFRDKDEIKRETEQIQKQLKE